VGIRVFGDLLGGGDLLISQSPNKVSLSLARSDAREMIIDEARHLPVHRLRWGSHICCKNDRIADNYKESPCFVYTFLHIRAKAVIGSHRFEPSLGGDSYDPVNVSSQTAAFQGKAAV
jgi:hypothetical protein